MLKKRNSKFIWCALYNVLLWFFSGLVWLFPLNDWNSITDWTCEHSSCKIYYILCMKFVEKDYLVHLTHYFFVPWLTMITICLFRIMLWWSYLWIDFYLQEDSREYKSSLITCPVQFNLSILSWTDSALYFPCTLTSVLVVGNTGKLLCHFSNRRVKV